MNRTATLQYFRICALILTGFCLTHSLFGQNSGDSTQQKESYSAYELISSFYDTNFHPFSKGNMYAGISFTIRDRQQENTTGLLVNTLTGEDLSFRIRSRAGYFIGDYVLTGLAYTYNENEIDRTVLQDSDTVTINSIQRGHVFTPYLRTYFPLTPNERLSFFVEVNFSLGFTNGLRRETVRLDEIDKQFTDEFLFGIGLSPGINFFAMQNFSFEVQLNIAGYELSVKEVERNETDISKDTRNNVNFNIDLLSLNLGIAYFINTGKK